MVHLCPLASPPPTRIHTHLAVAHPPTLAKYSVPGSGAAAALFTLSARHALTTIADVGWGHARAGLLLFTHNG